MPALPSALPPSLRRLLIPIALAIVYFCVAAGSMIRFGVETPIWFANAVTVVVLLKRPSREWPVLIGAAAIADVLVIMTFSGGAPPALALTDVTEITLVAVLLRRLGGADALLTTVTGLGGFILVALTVPVLSGAVGAAIVWWADGARFLHTFRHWYGASALGFLIVCPTLLIWSSAQLHGGMERSERVVTLLLLVGLGALMLVTSGLDHSAFLFATFPALLMLVWRSGLWGVSLGTAVVLGTGLWRTFSQEGAFLALAGTSSELQHQIEALQIYLGALTLSGLPLAVVLANQRRLASELERVANARGEFLAAMSHEIRTPMTGVLGMVDLLEAEEPSERQALFLSSIRSSGRHLLSVINDVLDFSRIETGRIELEHIDFSLPLLLEEVQGLLQPMATERGIKLAVGLGERSPPVVKGDPTRLRQILLNLGGNAIKFTPQGSVLVLAAHRPEDPGHRFRFEVRDTGIGITSDKLPHIFTAFTQADRSTSRNYGGSGLGLAISKRLVDAMGGEIGVESTPGEGSLFWFEVPFETGDAVNLPVMKPSLAYPIVPRRILLAEDVELNRDIIRTVLERDGHRVTIVANGQDAVDAASAERFDLVLMDVHMPVMDGLDATRAIRAIGGETGDTPIVALTANVMASEQAKCHLAGMNAVLMKPIDWEQVRAAIRQFTARGGEARAPAPARDESCFDEAAFSQLGRIIDPERLDDHAEALLADVRALTETGADPDCRQLAAAAHKIVSQAGMFGLARLSTRAADVEQAARAGVGLDAALERFREAAGDYSDHVAVRLKAMQR